MQENEELKKPYNPNEHEDLIYKKWEDSGFFNPDVCIEKGIADKDADYFSIVLPPPNVTGTLHMGSAFMLAIEDTMVRYNRMLGKKTLWVPGTDHAAIATQSKVEKLIQKEEGKNRHDLGRIEFLKIVEKFAQENHDTIVTQMKKMGCSLDWSREAFTLDEKRNLAVKTVFKKMFDDELIYKGHRVVNWDPKGQTTISDDEIVYEERKATMYTFKYSPDFPIAISTTRPETKVGDTAVAVNPDDTRYQKYIGQTFEIKDFAGERLSIKIIADKEVDPEFGTGALGVTPAHSQIDEGIAQRHDLPLKPVINEYARMSVESSLLKDKKVTEAREIVVGWLKDKNLMIKGEEVSQNVSTAERTGGIIEPLPKLQWFINVNKEFERDGKKLTLKKLMLGVIEKEEINIIPERFEKEYTHWIENLRDWCISRQIWYGHQIPVYYKGDEIYCGLEKPEGNDWIQDEDTLDTWFSSGLWTFSTLGWPHFAEASRGKPGPENDFVNYHPTTVLETGYDILFFWVARMILMSTYATGQIPFENVYLHGLVRDNQGKKISKSLGNNIDPLDMILKYSADSVRMALMVGTGPGNDTKISEEKLKAYKHFANKIWNASRFVLENTGSLQTSDVGSLTEKDQGTIKEYKEIVKDITSDMESYRFYLAADKIYHYFWHTFADIIIEDCKKRIKENDEADSVKALLYYLLREQLKLLHPFMPFITEKIWSLLPDSKNLLMVEKWPN
ncbi:MAG: valine--tRNA ligase [Candidatus Zambryskibacteria bacterium RIFOXYC1_FULL_39_10]|uniref:Valine--tRNA ligase n=1 Tax=Candidatus Zambryskibacteria bacterium RIFOXYC1_FULL_39_10 TaxID=1802779 RepID=A0A1G2V1B0_9BACT|nr:MAG: valine--tRNA ligase [Candidatus Zambryskibacteria bacterium RIFOXYC1_FULL_39_10]OHB16502.1 MAG: valine--tRNA ligase [Candidatus Zambryskibacteria bacterium RIFOXYD1_FULL_39_35]